MPLEKIIVVGAGLSGLALSLGLAAEGKHVEILEQRKDFSNRGATFGLNPSGIKALKELCPKVMSNLQDKGIMIPESNGLMFPWYEVRDALLEEVCKQGKIIVRLGCEIKAIENGSTSVTVDFTS
jgi:2-polyprenyl-6-methoxyphenol hydroxylase-like FAD-dependent oxidoreductase